MDPLEKLQALLLRQSELLREECEISDAELVLQAATVGDGGGAEDAPARAAASKSQQALPTKRKRLANDEETGTDSPRKISPKKSSHEISADIARAREFVQGATHFLFALGAGMGVPSGFQTFETFSAEQYKIMNLTYEDLCQPSVLSRDPHLFWGFWASTLREYRSVDPHPGYAMLWDLAKMAQLKAAQGHQSHSAGTPQTVDVHNNADSSILDNRAFVFTTNIDGHALISNNMWTSRSTNARSKIGRPVVYEVHGSLERQQCAFGCAKSSSWPSPETIPTVRRQDLRTVTLPPGCPFCKNERPSSRPNVRMFADPHFVPDQIGAEAYKAWKTVVLQAQGRRRVKLCIIEIGAGIRLPTVRDEVAEIMAHDDQVMLVRINPSVYASSGDSVQTLCDARLRAVHLKMDALLALRALCADVGPLDVGPVDTSSECDGSSSGSCVTE